MIKNISLAFLFALLLAVHPSPTYGTENTDPMYDLQMGIISGNDYPSLPASKLFLPDSNSDYSTLRDKKNLLLSVSSCSFNCISLLSETELRDDFFNGSSDLDLYLNQLKTRGNILFAFVDDSVIVWMYLSKTTDSIDKETRRKLISEMFPDLKTSKTDSEATPESALEMAAELLELPVETVRRFAAEQKTPAGETKVKSFISDKSLTVYDADNETLEIPAETLFTAEEELESYIEQFANQRIVLTAKKDNYEYYPVVKCKSGIEITLRSDQMSKAFNTDRGDIFSVWGVLLPPSDFYPYARIVDAVFIAF